MRLVEPVVVLVCRTSAQPSNIPNPLHSLEPDRSNTPPPASAQTVIILFCVWHGQRGVKVSLLLLGKYREQAYNVGNKSTR